jgi:GT2 family glycosyltransferase
MKQSQAKATSLQNKEPIDIWMVSYQRKEMTCNAINYLFTRTKHPYRLFVVDNNSTDGTIKDLERFEKDGRVFLTVKLSRNVGIHMAHNIGLSLVNSELCVSTDNDIYVPDLDPCWLTQLITIMKDKNYRNFTAVACQPHVFLGRSAVEEKEKKVEEAGHCGAVMRIMRTDVVRRAGGWCRHFDAKRNHEEKTIASHIRAIGGKVGYATGIKCYHDFGDDNNWGYKTIHPHEHGHRIPGDEIWPPPQKLKDNEKLYDPVTWERK